ncbi:hypothetical protein D3C87_2166780 [compost metagenome]
MLEWMTSMTTLALKRSVRRIRRGCEWAGLSLSVTQASATPNIVPMTIVPGATDWLSSIQMISRPTDRSG